MVLYSTSQFHIYIGDATDAMNPGDYLTWHDMSLLLTQPQIKPIVQKLDLHCLFFLHQVHGIKGYKIMPKTAVRPFAVDGDFLITNQLATGIGIVSADCLPVIVVDMKNNSIGIAHAGWRGALAGVVQEMVHEMQKSWNTSYDQCQFFLGPSAQSCCYKVGEEFQTYLAAYRWRDAVLQKKTTEYFFNLPLFIRYQLQQMGVADEAIETKYNICTICNKQFYSARRSQSGRQMTVVALKKADC